MVSLERKQLSGQRIGGRAIKSTQSNRESSRRGTEVVQYMLAVYAAPIICKRVVASFDMLDEKLELLKVEPPANELRQRRLMEPQQVAMVSLQTELDTKQETFALVDDEVNSKTFIPTC